MRTITFRGEVIGFVANEHAAKVAGMFKEVQMLDGKQVEIVAQEKPTESAYGQTTIEKQAFSVQLKLNYAGCTPEQMLFIANRQAKTDYMNARRIGNGDSDGTILAKRNRQAADVDANKANGFVLFDCSAIGKDGKVSERALESLDKKVNSITKNISSLTKEQRAELMQAIQQANEADAAE